MKTLYGLFPLTLLMLAACGGSEEIPTGQVVATVDGKEITAAELNAELANLPPAIAGNAQVQPIVLQSLVNRNILANEAAKEGLDKLPATAIMQAKAQQMVLVDALQKKIAEGVPAPSAEEAKQFVDSHPASFAQRRIFIVDQMIIPTRDVELLKALEPLNTLEEISAELVKRKIDARRTIGTIDALQIDPKAAEAIAALPPNAVFVSPEANTTRVNRVRDVAVEPVTGEAAIAMATQRLKARRTQEMVANRVKEIVSAGQGSVKFNAQYDPKTQAGAGNKPATPPAPQK